MLCSANLQVRAVFAMCFLKVSWSSKITPRFLTKFDEVIVDETNYVDEVIVNEPNWIMKLEWQGRQEAQSFSTPKPQKVINLMPRHLQTVLKRRGDAIPW